ncbi:MAG TPA: carbohydrate kinase family protein [Candidatus Limnocylindrales bacterium]|nr:carbohydrate kinase family protein [Candidatus Limnocylindrales bacterium]
MTAPTASAPTSLVRRSPVRVLVLGDLVLDVVLQASQPIESGTDVPGRVEIRQGGSAANAARWLARLGVRSQLVCAVGRDGAGRSLVAQLRRDSVEVRAVRIAGHRTGRIGVLVAPNGERSFVADRRAATRMTPADLKPEWFDGIDLIHLPAYSLLVEPLGSAAVRAVELTRSRGARTARVSVDLASVGPLMTRGRREARELVASLRPDLVFATEPEAEALVGRAGPEGLLEHAAVAVIKRGPRGARVFARIDHGRGEPEPPLRFDIATEAVAAEDTTGAGDAFDAGFIAGWLVALASGRSGADALHRATLAGHRTAARHLRSPRAELPPG